MKRNGYITEEEKKAAEAIPVESLVADTVVVTENKYQGYIDTVVDVTRVVNDILDNEDIISDSYILDISYIPRIDYLKVIDRIIGGTNAPPP